MSEPQLDWSQAEVKDGNLTVALAGEPPEGWNDTFEATAQLLSKGQWDDVTIKKDRVCVGGLSAGSEEKLRHFLESVVQQANATHESPEDDSRDDSEDDDDSTESDEAAQTEDEDDSSADTEMTERFRSFGQT